MVNRKILYDLLCIKADKLIKQYNPCNIRVEQTDFLFGRVVCNNKYMCHIKGENLCCGSCKYLGKTGCTTNSLGCKLGMCWQGDTFAETFCVSNDDLENTQISQKFIIKMDKLQKIAIKYDINSIRRNKDWLLELLW
jgi:hypothetical protein